MKLELFKDQNCPFCQRVMKFIEESGRDDVVYRDIMEDRSNADTLTEVGGKLMVPCLFIDGEPMYESMDIIAWLQDHPQEA